MRLAVWTALLLPVLADVCPRRKRIKPCQCRSVNDEISLISVACLSATSWTGVRHAMQKFRYDLVLQNLHIEGIKQHPRLKRLFRNLNVGEMKVKDSTFINAKGSLPKSVFRNSTIYSLSLHSVGLRRIPSRALSQLPMLHELYLTHNQIGTVGHKAFRFQTVSLRFLDLSANQLTRVPARALRQIKQLEVLNLQANRISKIASDDFDGLDNLVSLDLSWNSISVLQPDSFALLNKLQHLSLSNNPFPNDSETALLNHMSRINLTSLDISSCSLTVGGVSLFPLKTLIAQRKGEDLVFGETLANFPHLTHLDMNSNYWLGTELLEDRTFPSITELDVGSTDMSLEALKRFPNLLHVFIEIATLGKITENTFVSTPHLETIVFYLCGIRRINRFAFKPVESGLQTLVLSHNRIRSFSNKTFNGLRKLKELDLSYNYFRDDFEKQRFPLNKKILSDSSASLQRLSLVGNKLLRIPKLLIEPLGRLKHLNLAANDIVSLNRELWANTELETLNLYNNRITYIMADAFRWLGNLKVINLGYNELQSALNTVFFPPNLELLKLEHALIDTLESAKIKHLRYLRAVDLSDNRLRSLEPDTFYNSSSSLLYVDLSANPLDCSCTLRPFVEWLSSKRVTVSAETKCYSPETLRGQNLIARVCWSRCGHRTANIHFCTPEIQDLLK